MTNKFRQLTALLAPPPLQVGTVASVSDDIATVTLPGGGTIAARGQAVAGDRVFVQGSVIQGPAPDLPVELIEV